MKYRYEVVKVGSIPTWNGKNTVAFTNPVAIGDKIKVEAEAGELMRVESVEHYPKISVLYV